MQIRVATPSALRNQKIIFLPLFQNASLADEDFFSQLPQATQTLLRQHNIISSRGEDDDILSFSLPRENDLRLTLFGCGTKTRWTDRKARLLPRRMVQYAKKERISSFATPLLTAGYHAPTEAAASFATNAIMAGFEYTEYKTTPKEGWPKIPDITIVAPTGADEHALKTAITDACIIGKETNHCRTLANTPGGDMTPKRLAAAARETAKRAGLRITVFDETKIRKLGMGGVLGVARGSDEKPRFIIIEYHGGAARERPLVLVGKGVTFDTGGINLKPSHAILEMHMDMSGGAAVIQGIAAASRLRLPINIIGLVPAVENMPSGSSYRPGDILKTISGKTIEVLDTDAEGRVILSDAIAYGVTHYNPGLLVTFATLTGAAAVALGAYMSGLFTKEEDTALEQALVRVGRASGDYVWPLPLWDEYLADIKGTFGDIANVGKGGTRYGGASHGAKFLEQFAGNTRFAHIDIAPRMTTIESEYLAKGASGVGVRFIVELAKTYPHILKQKA